MSVTFSICCEETKKRLWIGQGSNGGYIYTGEHEVMENLSAFLFEHIGKPLYFVPDDSETIDDFDEYKRPVT